MTALFSKCSITYNIRTEVAALTVDRESVYAVMLKIIVICHFDGLGCKFTIIFWSVNIVALGTFYVTLISE